MASEQQSEKDEKNIIKMVEQQYQKIKENAETYPYVWGSYIVVYGGLALWTAYRWRKLRKTEDRVRALQARLRQLVESEEAAAPKTTTARKSSLQQSATPKNIEKPPSSVGE